LQSLFAPRLKQIDTGADFTHMSHESTLTTRPLFKKLSMLGAALSLLTPTFLTGTLLTGAFLTGCGSDSTPTNTVKAVDMTVGAMLPRTGPNANSDWVSAVELALNDMNAAVKKAKMAKPLNFKIDEQDTASNEAMALAAMGTYQAEGAKIAVTEASNAAIGSNKWNYDPARTDDSTKMPVISFTATSATLNKVDAIDADPTRAAALQDMSNWFFRTCPISDAVSAIRLAQVFSRGPTMNGDVNGDGKVKVVWIGSSDTSTVASITGDQTAFTKYVATLPTTAPGYIAETVKFDPGTDPATFDYGAYIAAATDNKDANMVEDFFPDLIINKALPTIAIPFIKAYKQNAANTIAILQDGSFRRNTLLASLGSAADGQVGVSNIAYMHNPSGMLFKTEQQAVTGFPPAAYEAQGYDAMALALLALIKASVVATDPTLVTGANTRDALNDLNHDAAADATVVQFGTGTDEFVKAIQAIEAGKPVDYVGASGNVNFDAVGNTLDLAVLWQIQGGQFVETNTFDCVTSSACLEIK
jgi:hypothetical protein